MPEDLTEEEKKCGICGSVNTVWHFDVGFDIDPSGEEKQHIQYCIDCHAERFFVDRLDYENNLENEKRCRYFSKWDKKDETSMVPEMMDGNIL